MPKPMTGRPLCDGVSDPFGSNEFRGSSSPSVAQLCTTRGRLNRAYGQSVAVPAQQVRDQSHLSGTHLPTHSGVNSPSRSEVSDPRHRGSAGLEVLSHAQRLAP